MLTLLIRKMRNTKWMVICLLIGFIMATAMTSTIPIYMHASLQRMLIKDMQAYQEDQGIYPGVYAVSKTIVSGSNAARQRNTVVDIYAKSVNRFNDLFVPYLNHKCYTSDAYLYITNIETETGEPAMIKLGGMTEIGDHINITSGRMFEPGKKDGDVYEVICSERAMQVAQVMQDTVYEVTNILSPGETVKIKIVGTFELLDDNDTYWSEGLSEYDNTMFCEFNTLIDDVIMTGVVNLNQVDCRIIIDYQHMDMNVIEHVRSQFASQSEKYRDDNATFTVPAQQILESYASKAASLKYIMLMLDIPVILMLIFYLFMVSQLNIESAQIPRRFVVADLKDLRV